MASDEITPNNLTKPLQNLHAAESNGNGHANGHAEATAQQTPVNWKGSITKHAIR